MNDTSKSAEPRIGNGTKEANATRLAGHSGQAASTITRDNRSRRFAELQAKGTRRTREENYEKQYLKVFEAMECGITQLLPPWEQEIAEYLDRSKQITGLDWCEFEHRTFERLRQFFANLKDQNAADEEPAAVVADSAAVAEPQGLANAPGRNEEGRGMSGRGWADINPPASTMHAHCYREQCRDCGMYRPVRVPGAPSSCWACGGVVVVVTSTFS